MKKNIVACFYIWSTFYLVACSGGEDLASKKAKLESLKSQIVDLNAQVDVLTKEIQALDTSASSADLIDSSKFKMVQVAVIKPTTFNHYIEVQGKVETDNNILLSSEAAGIIKDVKIKRGDKVKKGQVLAEIDDIMIKKGLEELKTSLDLAITIFEKQEKLWKENVGTEIQYLQAKSTKESLETRLAQLNEQLKKTKIIAPIDGEIDEVFKKDGEIISPGLPAFRIVKSTDFKVVAELSESFISKIQVGDYIDIYFPDIDKSSKEKITVVGSTINPVNRTFIIEAKLTRQLPNVKANLIAYLKINDISKANAMVVPVNTVQTSRSEKFVYLAKDNKVVRQKVEIADVYGNAALVTSGLSGGETLITFGYSDLTEGQNIKY